MSPGYELVAGLEVHCQLATRSKLFCGCRSGEAGAEPNTHVCPVCTGQPGVLPVLNRAAVELALKAALALDCRVAPRSVFARKNYFYPDLPKAYQISQYDEPFSSRGALEIALKDGASKRVRIHRIHLEEDAGKLLHAAGSRELAHSLVDFNRCGTPLIEIVSEPDISSPEEAHAYLTALKAVLQYSGASRCDMEKGEMRCDVNVSVRRKGEALGTRAEVKNLNSFKWVKAAVDHEFRRQVELIEGGGRVVQETRLWDSGAMSTRSMRSKEEAHDYRYFPEPDLLVLETPPDQVSRLKDSLPELPSARRRRYRSQYRLSEYDAAVLTSERALGDFFESAAFNLENKTVKTLVNLITTEFLGRLNAESLPVAEARISPEFMRGLATFVDKGVLSSKLAKKVFANIWDTGRDPDAVIEELGLSQISDEKKVLAWVEQALKANPKAAQDLRNGKERAIGAIIGSVMKLSKGKANPGLVNRLIKKSVGL